MTVALEIDLSFERVPYDWEHRKTWLDMPFPMDEYEDRVRRVRAMMANHGYDALLIYGGTGWLSGDVRWLSNFNSVIGNSVIGLAAEGEPMLATESIFHSAPMHSFAHTTWIRDFRPAHLPGTGVGHGEKDPHSVAAHLSDFFAENGLGEARVGVVGGKFMPADVLEQARTNFPRMHIESATLPFWQIKSIKSPREIAVMEEAAEATRDGLNAAMEAAVPGATELDVASAAASAMTKKAEYVGHNMVVAGPRSGLKHLLPSPRPIEDGDMVFVDMGVWHKGYITDTARVRCAGTVGRKQRDVLQCGVDMHLAVVDAARPGVRIVDLQNLAQSVAEKAGFGEYYWPTGFGHGIGTNVAELPSLHLGNETELQAGNIFALEPMIVIQGFGCGVIEDQVLIEENGARRLNPAREIYW